MSILTKQSSKNYSTLFSIKTMFPYNNVYELFFLYFNSDKRFKHYPSPKKLSLTPFIAFRIFEQNKKKLILSHPSF